MPIESTNNSFGNFRMGLFPPSGPDPSDSLNNGLSWYYTLDEATGTRFDSSPNALDLTQAGTVGQGPGVIGSSASFPAGLGNQLTSSYSPFYEFSASSFTFTGWFLLNNKVGNQIFIFLGQTGGSIADSIMLLRYNPGSDSVEFRVTTSSNTFASLTDQIAGTIPTGTPVFFTIMWDYINETTSLQLNGQTPVELAVNDSLNAAPTTQFYRLGNSSVTANPLDGLLDEIGGWGRLLTDAEIAFIYNSGAAARPDFTAVLEDGSGNTLEDGSNNILNAT